MVLKLQCSVNISEATECPMDADLDGRHRRLAHLRDLGHAQIVIPTQHQHLAIPGREARERLVKPSDFAGVLVIPDADLGIDG
jgi:hypothetical protein